MHFTCRPFLGRSADNFWSQFWENEPDDPQIFQRRGHLFGLISISQTNGQDPSVLGRNLISLLNENYYGSQGDFVPSALEKTINDLVSLPDYQDCSLSLLTAVVHQGQLYLCLYHSGWAIFRRNNKVSQLLSATPQSTVSLSGQIQDQDQLFLSTVDFYQAFTWEKIKNYLSESSLDSLEEDFLSQLNSFEDQSGMAAVLIQIHQDTVNSEEQLVENSQPAPAVESFQSSTTTPTTPLFSRFKFKMPSLGVKDVYVVHSDSPASLRRRKFNILISIIVLAALVVSSYFGYRRNLASQKEQHYQDLKVQLEAKINDALTVKNLNLDTALSLAQESNTIFQEMISYQSLHPEEVQNFQSQINSLLAQTGSSSGFTPESFYDTALIDSQLNYSRLITEGTSLYLLDSVHGRVDQLDITKKSHHTLINSVEAKDSLGLAVNNDKVYLLQNGNISVVDNGQVSSKIAFSDQKVDFVSGEFHFWNSSIYLLSIGSSESAIWKYAPAGTGFGAGQKWLKDSSSFPKEVTSFAINGDIWVITKTGAITPYSLGVKKEFTTPEVKLTSVSNLVTSVDSNILAFTDNGNQVYVFSKTGSSLSHYNFDNRRILSLAYNQDSNSLFVLCDDQKIYKIGL